MAWEEYVSEKIAHEMTLAEFAYLFFCSALNYEIDRLEDILLYDKPFKETADISTTTHKQVDDNNLHPDEKRERPDPREPILNELLALADKGDWVEGIEAEDIKKMLSTLLGVGDIALTAKEEKMSTILWDMLKRGRGNDRVKITWQNLVGYFADRKLFNKNGSPSLNKDFFGTNKDYSNIDKGRPSNDKNGDNMPPRFREIQPLLDKYVPKLKNTAK